MPTQSEIEAYLNFVRRPTRPAPQHPAQHVGRRDEVRRGCLEWLLETATGERFAAPFVVAASGILSLPLEPDIAGMATFEGPRCTPTRGRATGFDAITGSYDRIDIRGVGGQALRGKWSQDPRLLPTLAWLCMSDQSSFAS
jgi:hypothetical protein